MPRNLKILLFQFMIISQVTAGQTIVRSSFSCLGNSVSNDGIVLRQTIGQSSNTCVFKMEGLILRQGFQQAVKSSFNQMEETVPVDFILYPNPAEDRTLIKFKDEISHSIILMRDLNGNLLSEIKAESLTDSWLELKNYKPGIYLVTVISGNKKGSKKLIIKN